MRTLLVVLPLLSLAQEDDLAAAEAALRFADYEAARSALERCEASARSEYLWTNLYYDAGLPARAMEHARLGLEHEPDHLGLLHRATSVALWLALPEEARSFLERLERSIAGAGLDAESRRGWQLSVDDFRERTRELEDGERERVRALGLARLTSAGGLLLALGALVGIRQRTAGRQA